MYLKYVGSCKKDGPFTTDVRIVTLQPTKGTHWVAYIGQNSFDSYSGHPAEKLSKFNMSDWPTVRNVNMSAMPSVRIAHVKRNEYRFFSKNKIQGLGHRKDS